MVPSASFYAFLNLLKNINSLIANTLQKAVDIFGYILSKNENKNA